MAKSTKRPESVICQLSGEEDGEGKTSAVFGGLLYIHQVQTQRDTSNLSFSVH